MLIVFIESKNLVFTRNYVAGVIWGLFHSALHMLSAPGFEPTITEVRFKESNLKLVDHSATKPYFTHQISYKHMLMTLYYCGNVASQSDFCHHSNCRV